MAIIAFFGISNYSALYRIGAYVVSKYITDDIRIHAFHDEVAVFQSKSRPTARDISDLLATKAKLTEKDRARLNKTDTNSYKNAEQIELNIAWKNRGLNISDAHLVPVFVYPDDENIFTKEISSKMSDMLRKDGFNIVGKYEATFYIVVHHAKCEDVSDEIIYQRPGLRYALFTIFNIEGRWSLAPESLFNTSFYSTVNANSFSEARQLSMSQNLLKADKFVQEFVINQ